MLFVIGPIVGITCILGAFGFKARVTFLWTICNLLNAEDSSPGFFVREVKISQEMLLS